MLESRYSLRYLPGYEQDLNEILDYIAYRLHNPQGALNLLNRIEAAILNRLNCPLSFEPLKTNRSRRHSYYRIYIDNFTIYYVVIGNVMEVRRILYSGRNAGEIID